MKTKELLELLKITENDLFEKAQEAYNKLIAEQERLEKLKKMGAVNPFAPAKQLKINLKELQEAWQGINSESKYEYYKKTGTIQVEASPTTKKKAPVEQAPVLEHLVKDRPRGPAGRRPPAKKKFVAVQEVEKVEQVVDIHKQVKKEAPKSPKSKKIEMTQRKSPEKVAPELAVLTVKELQEAVLTAYTNYSNYHTKSENKQNSLYNRGQGAGFFSFLRHGAKGLATAKALCDSVKAENNMTIEETVKELKKFLGDSSRAYHHHSFTSYLADALADKGMITAHKQKHYSQKEVVKNLDRWLDNNGTKAQLAM